MKKILTIIPAILLALIIFSGCETQSQSSDKQAVYTGNLSSPIVIDTKEDAVITLKDVTAEMSESIISVDNAKSLTIILEGDNVLTVTGDDAKAIDSKDDLIIDGDGTLTISAEDTAIKSNDDLTIKSGTININTENDGLKANETLTIDGGNITVNAKEALEATEVIINGGNLNLTASDDGINAAQKSEDKSPKIEINGGNLTIEMKQGDTDALDSNGDLFINGGNINITAQFAFDFAGTAELKSGEVYVNGEKVEEISNSMDAGIGGHQGHMMNDMDGFPEGMTPPDGGFPEKPQKRN